MQNAGRMQQITTIRLRKLMHIQMFATRCTIIFDLTTATVVDLHFDMCACACVFLRCVVHRLHFKMHRIEAAHDVPNADDTI